MGRAPRIQSPIEAVGGDRAGLCLAPACESAGGWAKDAGALGDQGWNPSVSGSAMDAPGPPADRRDTGRTMTRHLDRETNPGDGFDCACGPIRITRRGRHPSKHTLYPTVPDGADTRRIPPQPLHRRRARACGWPRALGQEFDHQEQEAGAQAVEGERIEGLEVVALEPAHQRP
jgi:hypothetical protein